MFKISIFYDETIGLEDVPESVGIMCINCTVDNIKHPVDHLQSLLKVLSIFNISVLYDDTIGLEDVNKSFGIMCINSRKIIGCSLYNQKIEYIITPFFHKYGVTACWLILCHQIKSKTQF